MMLFRKNRRKYYFGSTRNKVTVKLFQQKVNLHDELFLEFFMTKVGEWQSIGTIPLTAKEDAIEALNSCTYQLNQHLKGK